MRAQIIAWACIVMGVIALLTEHRESVAPYLAAGLVIFALRERKGGRDA